MWHDIWSGRHSLSTKTKWVIHKKVKLGSYYFIWGDFVVVLHEVMQISQRLEDLMIQGDISSLLDYRRSTCSSRLVFGVQLSIMGWNVYCGHRRIHNRHSLGTSQELPHRLKWLVCLLIAVDWLAKLLSFKKFHWRCPCTRDQHLLLRWL